MEQAKCTASGKYNFYTAGFLSASTCTHDTGLFGCISPVSSGPRAGVTAIPLTACMCWPPLLGPWCVLYLFTRAHFSDILVFFQPHARVPSNPACTAADIHTQPISLRLVRSSAQAWTNCFRLFQPLAPVANCYMYLRAHVASCSNTHQHISNCLWPTAACSCAPMWPAPTCTPPTHLLPSGPPAACIQLRAYVASSDNGGRSAADYASNGGFEDIALYLRKLGKQT